MSGGRQPWAALPKAELHVHLRGAMPAAFFRRQVERYGTAGLLDRASPGLRSFWERCPNLQPFLADQWTESDLDSLFSFTDFDAFLGTFAFTGCFIRTAEDFRELLHGVLCSLAQQRIVYAELTVSLREYLLQGIALEDLLAALDEVTVPGLRAQYLVDLVRNFGADAGLDLLRQVARRECRALVGLTIGGSEHHYPPAQFVECYHLARELGLRRSVHAGEALGPESVRDALDLLGAERIGHGIRAIEDPALVERLAAEQIPLEVSPTSNLCTGVVATPDEHPVARLVAAGVPVSINTDDPTFFGTTLADEYAFVARLGLEPAAVLELVRNGFRHAWLSAAEREAYLAELACQAGSTDANSR